MHPSRFLKEGGLDAQAEALRRAEPFGEAVAVERDEVRRRYFERVRDAASAMRALSTVGAEEFSVLDDALGTTFAEDKVVPELELERAAMVVRRSELVTQIRAKLRQCSSEQDPSLIFEALSDPAVLKKDFRAEAVSARRRLEEIEGELEATLIQALRGGGARGSGKRRRGAVTGTSTRGALHGGRARSLHNPRVLREALEASGTHEDTRGKLADARARVKQSLEKAVEQAKSEVEVALNSRDPATMDIVLREHADAADLFQSSYAQLVQSWGPTKLQTELNMIERAFL